MMGTFQSALKFQNIGFWQANDSIDHEKVVRVAFILLDHFSLTALSTAMDALATGNLINSNTVYKVSTYSLQGGLIESDIGIPLPSERLNVEKINHEVVVIVGGQRVRLSTNPAIRRVLKKTAGGKGIVAGVWNAAFYLADAGLLDDQHCACHADSCALINEYYPQVKTVAVEYTFSQHRATCAGASSALDMILAIMQNVSFRRDADVVDEIKRVHQPRKLQLNEVTLGAVSLARAVPRVLDVAVALMENHIEEPMDIDEIASHVGVSRRQLERRFARYLNVAPNRYYLELRLTRARQLIIQSNRSLTDVALATGFVSYPHFYKRFKDLFGLPPMTFRGNYYSSDLNRSERYAIAAGF
ncbi:MULTISPECIES: GlxA family transcriptional regulator [Pseudomonas syringae group]|uniref:AraC family transcriptional regulator n=3 Tax=Pseudomonas syringae group TaxID=136849 RepID=A0A2K4WWF2_PSESX|nr:MULTISPECIES: helix-turn-helix domain-containing protein [Pseudomonas syringae group]MDT3222561.1 helix-turn-helix domain-containing protein [Pseudomonas amygdali pv. morsprunorum]MDT3242251.1 helix-turn-helix domain-containing protein [Pseudomonas amygdali pv. morsprunorum]MDT3265334.1 helix-turn-helix domain-containing protein [Pseudomonas amygdali pv. morsprunorum]RMO15893.1 Transcriptional regulator, AraC family [Pseudomonas amygdali pv. morsprunorum]RMP03507.1 Transcriptional regulator